MTGAMQRWIVASVAGVSLVVVAGAVFAADATDADRTFRNFTRETATVAPGQVRVEVRGLSVQDEENTRLNTLGLLQLPKGSVDSVHGGIIDLLLSYGFVKNAEVGIDIPGYIEEKHTRIPTITPKHFVDGFTINSSDIGDISLYGKFQRSVATHCAAGGGLELSLPNGPEHKGFGTGELGINPFISSRYQRGRFALGANVGYQLYSGGVKDVFNYGIEAIVRGSDTYALRAEVAGRVWNEAGQRWHDATLLPGIDFNLSNNVTIRPTGLANLTKTALDWGVGLGVAATF